MKLLTFKRTDQYVKKFWSRAKTIIYSSLKDDKLKSVALDEIRKLYEFNESDATQFENLFGSEVKHGLKKETIIFILSHSKIFDSIFNVKFFNNVISQMETQTEKDIDTNIIKKLAVIFEQKSEKSIIESIASEIDVDRKFKKPFTKSENLRACIEFVGKFFKCCNKPIPGISESIRSSRKESINKIKVILDKKMTDSKWAPTKQKFKKSELVSCLFFK